MTKIIGLTGGIGSGKTTVANHFLKFGVPIYIADEEARKISNKPNVIKEIESVFGAVVFTSGNLNREKLAEIVFEDPTKLSLLNAIIHPKVQKHFKNWVKRHENAKYVIKESAVLFESGSYKGCLAIIGVFAPLEIRIQRVISRENVSRATVLKRIQNQWNDEDKMKKCDFVIYNIDPEQTFVQINEIYKKLQNL